MDIKCSAKRKNEAKKITRPFAFHAPAYYFNYTILIGEPYEQTDFRYSGRRRDFHNGDIRADKTACLHVHRQPRRQDVQN